MKIKIISEINEFNERIRFQKYRGELFNIELLNYYNCH